MIARRYSASKYVALDASTRRHNCSASSIRPPWIAATARCIACGTVKGVIGERSQSPQLESFDQRRRTDLVPFAAEGGAKSGIVLHIAHRGARNDAALLRVLA